MKLKNMKIGSQIILVTFSIAIITILGLSFTSIHYFSQYARQISQEGADLGIGVLKDFIELEKRGVVEFRDQFLLNDTMAELVANRDTQSLNTEVLRLMNAGGIDIVMISDSDGTVISRPHDPGRLGDSLANDETVKRALSGETWEMMMSAPSTLLGYYAGGPIRSKDGEIIGMIRAATSLENESLVDRVKVLCDVEVTVFAGNIRISSTLIDNGKRVVGTEASERVQQAVLRDGRDVAESLEIFGNEYFTVYSPIVDPGTGAIMGIYSSAKSVEDSNQAIRSTVIGIAGISVAVFVIAFLLSLFLARSISKPLGRIVAISERGQNGDLTIKKEDFQYNRGGELGALVSAMSKMISSQQETLSQVISTADDVTTQVATLSSLSEENTAAMSSSGSLIQKVSELCNVNARAVEMSATSVSEMAEGADSVAKMSTESAESLAKTTQMSQQAANSVSSLVSDIKLVDEKTNENKEKINTLSDSVAEISNFMGVIASIADQTNLLALNAAIEAARAGEAGRGFAVVAEEVRKLAEDSRSASKSVEELVTILSQNAEMAISMSEQSAAIVSDISSKAEAVADGLNNALSEITNANEAIQSIAAVAQEQAASSSEITRSIDEIKQSTDEISGTLNELNQLSGRATDVGMSVSSSAQQMAGGVEDLKDVLSRFHI